MIENNNIDDLLVKVVLGESNAEELRYVQGWIAESSANERYFRDFQRIWEESRHLAVRSTVDEELAWVQFKERVDMNRVAGEARVRDMEEEDSRVVDMGGGRRYQWLLRVAAIFFVVCAGGWFYYMYSYRPAQYLSVNSGGQVLSDTLSEGSVVTLNKQSFIRYRRQFAGDTRQVEMEGEAFFAVAADKNKAFVVHANGVTITVLGTSFNVRAIRGRTEVIVETGLVEINKGGHVVWVGAHEKAVIDMGNTNLIKENNPDQLYNYYRTKTFECNGTPLWRLVEKLNEVYNVHIVIGESRLRDLPLTTTFVDESLDGILNVVGRTFDIGVVRNGEEIILK